MLKHIRLAFILVFVVSCSSQTKNNENILAEIDGLAVSEQHFQNAFKEYYLRTGQVMTPDPITRKAILDSEFNTYVLAVHAKDEGLDATEKALQRRQSIEKRVITEEYLDQQILANVEVTEADLRQYYLRFNSLLRASHIYARTQSEIEAYYERLQNGESFEALAKEAFQNEYLADNGGDIGRFTTDELDIAFENQAFAMNIGDVSKPVRTAQGFSIIKLTEKVTKPIVTEYEFAQAKPQLQSYVWKKKRELATRDHMYNFVEKSEINENVFENLYALIEQSYDGMLGKNAEFISNLNQMDANLLMFEEFEFDTDAFAAEYAISTSAMLNGIYDRATLQNFIKGVAYRAYMVEMAERAEITKQALVKDSINETWYHYLAAEVMQQLEASITNTQAELFEVYEEERENFYKPLEIDLQRIVLRDKVTAQMVMKKLKQGQDFTELVLEYTSNNEDRFVNGNQGFKPVTDYGYLSTKLANLEQGDVSEIFEYSDTEYHIYKCLGFIEARALNFDEAREMVNNFLTKKKLQQLRAETISQVKQRHEAVVDIEKLNEVTIQI